MRFLNGLIMTTDTGHYCELQTMEPGDFFIKKVIIRYKCKPALSRLLRPSHTAISSYLPTDNRKFLANALKTDKMPYPPFEIQPYPFNTPCKDQIISSHLRRIRRGPSRVQAIPPEPNASSPPAPPPAPPSASTQKENTSTGTKTRGLRKYITTAKTKLAHCLSKAYLVAFSTMKATKLFHSLFCPDPLGDSDSDTARMLHALWEDAPPRHWTYETAARRPSTYHVIAARRPFLNDTTGRPIWELEAEAAERATQAGEA